MSKHLGVRQACTEWFVDFVGCMSLVACYNKKLHIIACNYSLLVLHSDLHYNKLVQSGLFIRCCGRIARRMNYSMGLFTCMLLKVQTLKIVWLEYSNDTDRSSGQCGLSPFICILYWLYSFDHKTRVFFFSGLGRYISIHTPLMFFGPGNSNHFITLVRDSRFISQRWIITLPSISW